MKIMPRFVVLRLVFWYNSDALSKEKTMKMQIMAALCMCMAGVVAADTGDAFLLQTKNTTLALRRQHGTWNVAHYGAKVASEADAAALAWDRWSGGNHIAQRRPAAYAAYGGDREHGYGFNKWGGLQVTHADGCLTLHLVGEKAETVPDAPGATHVVLKQRDRVYPFFVTQHFRALEASDVIETWVELKNGEAGAVRLGRMDSFAMDFPLLANAFRLHRLAQRRARRVGEQRELHADVRREVHRDRRARDRWRPVLDRVVGHQRAARPVRLHRGSRWR